MRKLFFLIALAVVSFFSTGCVKMVLEGPNGVEEVIPLRRSMFVQVYNKCVPILRASGNHHTVDIPQGRSGQLALPAVAGENKDKQEVVFEGFTRDGRGAGSAKHTFYPDYNSAVTREKFVVGGPQGDLQLQSNVGNVCEMFG